MCSSKEPDEVYKALVAELAYTIAPSTVMGLTLVAVGTFAFTTFESTALLTGTVVGGTASLAKVIMTARHRWFNTEKQPSLLESRQWERSHALLTFLVAASVGALSSCMFQSDDLPLHILATALLFGYCSGVASRVSVRPLIAAAAISLAAVPTTICAALSGDDSHLLLATMFSVFLIASMQSVWHVYRTASRQIESRLEIERYARHDVLTGPTNRMGLREAFHKIPRSSCMITAVHCFDLDGFKAVNDRFGHAAGDELLATIGQRLQNLLSNPDVASRNGGDEFVVLQSCIREPIEADLMAKAIMSTLSAPIELSSERITIGASLGYTIMPSDTAELCQMMRLADLASYRAKRKGGGVEREILDEIDQQSADASRITSKAASGF